MKEKDLKILVIGESCTDKFIYCRVDRLSPEAPVPVLIPAKTIKNPGMAGNVVSNLKALEPNHYTMLMGQTEVITKTRYVEEKSNHMFFRLDEGEATITPLKWTLDFETILKDSDIVIVSDYNKGFLDDNHLWTIGHLAKLSILDTKRKLTQEIANKFSFIKLNEGESKNNSHLNSKNIITTLGRGVDVTGALLFPKLQSFAREERAPRKPPLRPNRSRNISRNDNCKASGNKCGSRLVPICLAITTATTTISE